MQRTPAYWPARILLAIGIVTTVAVVLAVLAVLSGFGVGGECVSCDRSSILGVPASLLFAVLAIAAPIVGLAWMVRILRGPRDEPPPWRHRDRR